MVVEASFRILDADPLSAVGFTHSETRLARSDWNVSVITDTRAWADRLPSGQVVFRYEAGVQTFVKGAPFEEKHIQGTIPRRWV